MESKISGDEGCADLILLGAILLFMFLDFLYAILGLVSTVVFKWGSSNNIDQCVAKIFSIFLYLVWNCVMNLVGCFWAVGGLM